MNKVVSSQKSIASIDSLGGDDSISFHRSGNYKIKLLAANGNDLGFSLDGFYFQGQRLSLAKEHTVSRGVYILAIESMGVKQIEILSIH